jgi:hypothetical protein
MPISINICCDGAHNAVTMYDNPKDQSGYFIKIYSWYTAAVECVSKTQRITLSSTEAEVAYMVLALRSAPDLPYTLYSTQLVSEIFADSLCMGIANQGGPYV